MRFRPADFVDAYLMFVVTVPPDGLPSSEQQRPPALVALEEH